VLRESDIVETFALSFSVGALLMFWVIGFSKKNNLLDHPNHRKNHEGGVPITGGVAIFIAFALASLTLNTPLAHYKSFFALCLGMTFVGFLDDVEDILSREKFLWQIIIAILMVYWGKVEIATFGFSSGVSGGLQTASLSVPFTVIAVVGFVNAMNMFDGMDGQAGSYSIIALSLLSYVAISSNNAPAAALMLTLIMTTLAFLLFNMRFPWNTKARLFMGDSGSMFLGLVIAWFSIVLFQSEKSPYPPIVALWILATPVWDTLRLIIVRLAKGKNPFHGDMNHIHHVLQQAGLSVNHTLLVIVVLSAGSGIFGLLGINYMSDFTSLLFFMGFFVVYCVAIAMAQFKAKSSDNRLIIRNGVSGEYCISGSEIMEYERESESSPNRSVYHSDVVTRE